MTPRPRPTSVRYVVLGLTTLVAVMLYLDRYCVGFVAQDVRDQLRLSQAQVDWLQGAFFVTYAFGQIPCGWLSDRFGPRAMLSLYLLTWSALTGMMGLAVGFATLLLFRLGCGLFEAGAYPACAGLIRRWAPFRERGLASGIVSIGGRIGGAIAFPLTAYLMIAFAPLSSSVDFSARDVIDPAAVARRLVLPAASDPGTFGRALAEHLASRMSADQTAFLTELASRNATDVSPEELRQLVDTLNALLRRPDLVAGLDLAPYRSKIAPEAMTEATPTSEHEPILRNRLLLEVALPGLVCKYYGWGWRPTLMTFGTAGMVLAVVFWSFFRNRPHEHFLVNAAEVALIEGSDAPAAADAALPPAGRLWHGILTSPSLWLCSLVQFGTNFSWVFLGTKMPEYLERVHQVPRIEQGWMVGLAFLFSVPMTLAGGWWTDRMTRRWGPRLGRSFPMASTRFAAAAAFAACLVLSAPWPITLALCAFSVISDMGLPAVWAYNLDVGGRNVGMVLGWGNMWGNFGAALSPYALGRIQEHFGWDAVFLTCSLVLVAIGLASCFIDATRPIVPDPGRGGDD
jgi:sugar phosphate permease